MVDDEEFQPEDDDEDAARRKTEQQLRYLERNQITRKSVYLRPEELEMVEAQAAKRGLGVSPYLVALVREQAQREES